MRMRSLFLLAGCAAAFAGCDTEPATMPEAEPSFAVSGGAALNHDLATIRAATARFHDLGAALAAGYAPSSECVAVPGLGGMGVHYTKMPLVMDATFSPTEPEALLYAPRPDGSMQLVAVEYVMVQDFWHRAGNVGRPGFHGRAFDDGPVIPGVPATYTLHAWVWQPNPAGVLEPFNPRVNCAAAQAGATGHAH